MAPPFNGASAADYTVQAGDNLNAIAGAQGTTLDQILRANPQITNPDLIYKGQVIKVPPRTVSAPATELDAAPPAEATGINGGITCSAEEFAAAITSCGYNAPSDQKRVNMLASIQKLGGKEVIASKRELAMFLAQIMHESGGLSKIEEVGRGQNYGYGASGFWGRGYIQLTHDYNYKAASRDLAPLYGFPTDELVKNPNRILEDDSLAWAVSTWFWRENVHGKPGVSQGNFGATSKAINGNECNPGAQVYNRDAAKQRCAFYVKTHTAFSIPGIPSLTGC